MSSQLITQIKDTKPQTAKPLTSSRFLLSFSVFMNHVWLLTVPSTLFFKLMLLYFNQNIKPLELNGPFWYIREQKCIDHSWSTGWSILFMQKTQGRNVWRYLGSSSSSLHSIGAEGRVPPQLTMKWQRLKKYGVIEGEMDVEGESFCLCWVVILNISLGMHVDLCTHAVTLLL